MCDLRSIVFLWLVAGCSPSEEDLLEDLPESETDSGSRDTTSSPWTEEDASEGGTTGDPFVRWPRIAYWGTFDWAGAQSIQNAYVFENDLGYAFRLETFQLAVASIQLRPCTTEDTGEESGVVSSRGLAAIIDRQAIHGVDNDPSMIFVGAAEDAFDVSLRAWGQGEGGELRYCRSFWLAGPVSESNDVLGSNGIVAIGAYRAPQDAAWSPFEVGLPLSTGALAELTNEPDGARRPADDGEVDVDIIVTRYPTRAFDGLDPAAVPVEELVWQAMRKMLETSTVSYAERDCPGC